jgi:hypothetical protein
MTSTEAVPTHGEAPTMHRLIVGVPIVVIGGGLLGAAATESSRVGVLAAAIVLGWTQLAGL